jgi:hypothetical protein
MPFKDIIVVSGAPLKMDILFFMTMIIRKSTFVKIYAPVPLRYGWLMILLLLAWPTLAAPIQQPLLNFDNADERSKWTPSQLAQDRGVPEPVSGAERIIICPAKSVPAGIMH